MTLQFENLTHAVTNTKSSRETQTQDKKRKFLLKDVKDVTWRKHQTSLQIPSITYASTASSEEIIKKKKKKPRYLEHQFTIISSNKYHLPREPMANAGAAHQEPRSHAHFGAWHLTFIHPKHKKTRKTQWAINEMCKYNSV